MHPNEHESNFCGVVAIKSIVICS